MKKRISLLLSLVLLVSALSGCAVKNEKPAEQAPKQEVKQEQKPEVKPAETKAEEPKKEEKKGKVVVDDLGREVTIPENPKKIIAMTSAVMEALYSIDVKPIARVEEYKIREEGANLPSIGKTNAVNVEQIIALEPDLIIAATRFHASIQKELEKSNAVVFYFNPDSVGEIPLLNLSSFMAELFDKQAEAKAFEDKVMKIAGGFKEKIASSGIKTGLILQPGDAVSAVHKETGYGSLFTLLGIENIVPTEMVQTKKSNTVTLDAETVISKNPDVILLIAGSKEKEENMQALKKFKTDDKWKDLNAVKNNKVFILPFAVNPNRSNVEKMLTITAKVILGEKIEEPNKN